MSKIRGTSNVPMMLGIIGGVLGLPAALCTGACAACVGAVGSAGAALAVTDPNSGITEADATAMTAAAGSAATILMAIAIAGSLAGLIGGLLGKKAPALAGVIMILSALFNAP
ncbi:MAG: DUF4064 domain-containing protein [Opitutaceae bacterium]|nr:DUF4064 domain-containing protein [Opitutaceae bacterium]